MNAIIYNNSDSIQFNGSTFYKVIGLYKGQILPQNSFSITDSTYDAWESNLTDFHYINANNKTIGSAVKSQDKIGEFLSNNLKLTIKSEMMHIWSEVQVLSDLGENTDTLSTQYQNLINEYQNI